MANLLRVTRAVSGGTPTAIPYTSLYEAGERDFRFVFIADATSGMYERGVQELQGIGVTVMNTHACLAWTGYPT